MAEEYQMKKEYEARLQEENGLFDASTNVTIFVNATRILMRRSLEPTLLAPWSKKESNRGFADILKIDAVTLSQSWSAWITPKTELTVGGGIVVKNGLGRTEFTTSIQRMISPSWTARLSGTIGSSPSAFLRLHRPIGQKRYFKYSFLYLFLVLSRLQPGWSRFIRIHNAIFGFNAH
jgi:hypothetical protein